METLLARKEKILKGMELCKFITVSARTPRIHSVQVNSINTHTYFRKATALSLGVRVTKHSRWAKESKLSFSW